MKKTAKQLAEELGVSATTVSLAFRGSKSISKATRDRVLAAAKAAGMQAAAVLDGQPPEALAALRAEADEFIASFEEFAASLPRRAE